MDDQVTVSRFKWPRVTAMILAGGRVGELSVLTLERPKSALPFAGHFRIIDFPLSNLYHAGINNVGILSQYRPASLIDHIGVGESWDFIGLDRGAKILPPYHAAEGSDWYRGNADAVCQNLRYLEEHDTEIALILSGDHIYSMDYRDLIFTHLERGADLTIAFKRVEEKDRRFGYGVLDDSGQLVSYEEKPSEPRSDLASLTIYAFRMSVLAEVLTGMRELDSIEFGRDVIPEMLSRHRVCGYLFDGYWAYTRTIDGYYAAHQDLLAGEIDLDAWMVRTNNNDNSLARQTPSIFRTWTEAEGSLFSEGCVVDGKVTDSVLGPGVHVRRGAVVESSILFNEVVVGPGAHVRRAIVDKRVAIGEEVTIGVQEAPERAQPAPPVSPRGITIVGKGAVLADGAHVPRASVVHPRAVIETRPAADPGGSS
jgi:glucose-1-phosphate adenylyltransferase